MKKTCVALALATLASCSPLDENGDPSDVIAEESADLTSGTPITCTTLKVNKGGIGSGQSVAGLKTAENPGQADADWKKYVEFNKGSEVECSFTHVDAVPTKLTVRASYRGPVKSEVRWTFEAYNYSTKAWVYVTDNSPAKSWAWTKIESAIPGTLSQFISGGTAKVRYRTTSTVNDQSDLDLLVLVPTVSSGTGGTGGGGTGGTGGTAGSGGTVGTGGTGGTAGSGGTVGTGGTGGTSSIWHPKPGTTWNWQLQGTLKTTIDAQMYDIDLFGTSAAAIADLHAKGRTVICYLSAGTWEDWRPDASQFPTSTYKNNVEGWPGERWLDIRSQTVRALMSARMDMAVSKKCDGVEPDNVDGFEPEDSENPTDKTGFKLTAANQLDYNKFLAKAAHDRGLSIGLKNDLAQVSALQSSFDWALNEECLAFEECDKLAPFINAGKAVFHAEYKDGDKINGKTASTSVVCPLSKPLKFSSLVLNMALDGTSRAACP